MHVCIIYVDMSLIYMHEKEVIYNETVESLEVNSWKTMTMFKDKGYAWKEAESNSKNRDNWITFSRGLCSRRSE